MKLNDAEITTSNSSTDLEAKIKKVEADLNYAGSILVLHQKEISELVNRLEDSESRVKRLILLVAVQTIWICYQCISTLIS